MKKTVSILAGVLLFAFSSTLGAQEKIRIGIGSVSLQSVLPFIGRSRQRLQCREGKEVVAF